MFDQETKVGLDRHATWRALDDLLRLDERSVLAAFCYGGSNLGDSIQTLALLQHVRVGRLVLRDELPSDPELVLAANGWMTKGRFPTSRDFRAVRYLGIHIPRRLRTPRVAEQLRLGGVVGCRDRATQLFLESHGVPAAFCGCSTLTFPPYHGPREHIVCVDVPDRVVRRVRRRYGQQLGEVLTVTHRSTRRSPSDVDGELIRAQFDRAYHLLGLYRTAALVVTSRLHAALPCLAFGTPLIVLHRGGDRFAVLEEFELDPSIARDLSWLRSRIGAGRIPGAVSVSKQRSAFFHFLRETLDGLGSLSRPVPC